MNDLVLGRNGFVGSNLMLHYPSSLGVGRKDIHSAHSRTFHNVYCAAPQAKKWWANQNPSADRLETEYLLECCSKIKFNGIFFHFSTVDVYDPPVSVDERSTPNSLSSYGKNRSWLESELMKVWGQDRLRIIRLPALVGKGLKKNVIFDLMNRNCLDSINCMSSFQWFNLSFLPEVIEKSLNCSFSSRLNVSTEPVPTSMIVDMFFPELIGSLSLNSNEKPVRYDVQSINSYLYSADDVINQHLFPFISSGGDL
jgi:hypothetical protein